MARTTTARTGSGRKARSTKASGGHTRLSPSASRSVKSSAPEIRVPETPAGNPPLPVVGATIDDAALLLLQLDPSERSGFERLGEIFDAVGSDRTVAPEIRGLTESARQTVERYLSGTTSDARQVLCEISALLEAASNLDDAPPPRPGPTPELPLEPEPQHSPQPQKAAESIPAPPTSSAALAETEPDTTGDGRLPADFDADLIGEFVVESRELLEKAEAALLALESSPGDTEAVNVIFRGFHTIKGTSAFLGLTRVSGLAHCAESLLSRVRDGEIRCAGGYADLALRSVDMLKLLVEGVQAALGGKPMQSPQEYDRLKELLSAPEAAGISDRPAVLEAAGPVPGEKRHAAPPPAKLPDPSAADEPVVSSPQAEVSRPAAEQRRPGRPESAIEASVRVRTPSPTGIGHTETKN